MPRLDTYDKRIIAALQDDARMPIAAVADRVALSATPVSRRVRRLEEDGVIAGYAPVLDARKLGFELQAYVLINLQAHRDDIIVRFEKAIRDNPYVVSCHAVTGDMDYILQVIARDVEHLSQITLKTLVRLDGVRDVKSIISLEAIKDSRAPPLD